MGKASYYDISNVLSTKSQYIILYGQRANGKSYQSKQTVIENAYKNNKRFVYLRRWKEDIKNKFVQSYFNDMDVKKITNGEYDCIKVLNGSIFFATYDEKGNTNKVFDIGVACALNMAEHYKSTVFDNVDFVIFEEFITDNYYLDREPTILQQFASTVFRHRKGTVIMIGNTLTRVCPYFTEWSLEGVLKQKIGTIDIYHHHTSSGKVINIAVEYCKNASGIDNNMFFGSAAKQIVSGEWDTEESPKLQKKREEYKKIYEICVIYDKFKFALELLMDKETGGIFVFIYPSTKNRKIERVITQDFSTDIMTTSKLDLINNKGDMYIDYCLRNDKVCYSDNLTASDFKNVMRNFDIGTRAVF